VIVSREYQRKIQGDSIGITIGCQSQARGRWYPDPKVGYYGYISFPLYQLMYRILALGMLNKRLTIS
jgi:hypothetical protein